MSPLELATIRAAVWLSRGQRRRLEWDFDGALTVITLHDVDVYHATKSATLAEAIELALDLAEKCEG